MKASNGGMIQVSQEAIKAISLNGDYSKISEQDRLSVVLSICDQLNLNPALNPFNYITNKDGKIMLYPNKSCAAQLSSNRKLKCEVVSEGLALDSVYTVKVRVTEGERVTEDVGAVAVTYFKKGDNGQPGAWVKLEGAGIADAIKKAHTQAKRRAVLAHCGLGLPESQEEEPLVVIDTPSKVTTTPEPEPAKQQQEETKKLEAPKQDPGKWTGKIASVRPEQLPTGKPCWTVIGHDGSIFKTADEIFQPLFDAMTENSQYEIKYEPNKKGTWVILRMKEVS